MPSPSFQSPSWVVIGLILNWPSGPQARRLTRRFCARPRQRRRWRRSRRSASAGVSLRRSRTSFPPKSTRSVASAVRGGESRRSLGGSRPRPRATWNAAIILSEKRALRRIHQTSHPLSSACWPWTTRRIERIVWTNREQARGEKAATSLALERSEGWPHSKAVGARYCVTPVPLNEIV
jgi:hypothetical protein